MATPIRSCIACRKRENRTDLLRVVLVENQLTVDVNHQLPGRGAWVHRSCIDVALARKAFGRALRSEIAITSTLNEGTV
jgi:predicted RNA-binding protein YlxR (DUF448 family)